LGVEHCIGELFVTADFHIVQDVSGFSNLLLLFLATVAPTRVTAASPEKGLTQVL